MEEFFCLNSKFFLNTNGVFLYSLCAPEVGEMDGCLPVSQDGFRGRGGWGEGGGMVKIGIGLYIQDPPSGHAMQKYFKHLYYTHRDQERRAVCTGTGIRVMAEELQTKENLPVKNANNSAVYQKEYNSVYKSHPK